jgi:aldose 1-epimerase
MTAPTQRRWATVLLALIAPAVPAADDAQKAHAVGVQPFGRMPDGTAVDLYTLTNARGLEAQVSTLGATLIALRVPDRAGTFDNVLLGRSTFDEYRRALLGAVVGRYANRIAGARFTLDGAEYTLDANSGKHHIHGGRPGFQGQVWQAEPVREPDAVGVRLRLVSPDGQAGYPGTVRVTAVYRLTNADEVVMEYTATTDQPTHVNLTNHAYWNLAGAAAGGDVLGHVLTLHADRYLPTDKDLIPTGELRPVAGTPLDFTRPRPIGSRIGELDPKRYDHCFVLGEKTREAPALAARVVEPTTGRVMDVSTTQPGVQFYTGNPRGLCLETQHFPNAPNEPRFPSTVLRPGQTYRQVTVHRFAVAE